MPNVYLANGSSGISALTLGDISAVKFELQIDNFTWANRLGYQYLFTQGGGSAVSDYDISLEGDFINDDIELVVGGTLNILGTYADVFGSTDDIVDASFSLVVNTDNTYSISLDGSVVSSGTINRGTSSLGERPIRIGARNAGANNGLTVMERTLREGTKIGDTRIYLNDTLTRNYVMPANADATTVPDTQSNQDGTLYNGDNTDFEAVSGGTPVTTRRVTFDIPAEIRALSTIGYSIQRLPLGTGVLVDSGTLNFSSATQEFNLDSDDTITNGMALALTASDSTSPSNDSTAGVMFGTANAVVTTS